MNQKIPNLRVVIATSIMAIAGYATFSIWVVVWSADAAMKGDVIGTWKSFAVLAFGFWLGSSSSGKAKDDVPTGRPLDPVSVTSADVTNVDSREVK